MTKKTVVQHSTPVPPLVCGQRGLTLVEVLIALLLVLVVALGIAQLFHRSIVSTYAGRESSQVTNLARSTAEEVMQAGFNSTLLTLDGGTEEEVIQVWIPTAQPSSDPDDPFTSTEGRWVDEADAPADAEIRWRRTVRLRQYSISDLLRDAANDQELDQPLDASTPLNFVHLKEVEVELEPTRAADALGAPKTIFLRTLKAF